MEKPHPSRRNHITVSRDPSSNSLRASLQNPHLHDGTISYLAERLPDVLT